MQTVSEIDTAQICKNGHIVNLSCKYDPVACSDYCPQCGEKTITKCPHCFAPIRGNKYTEVPVWLDVTDTEIINEHYQIPDFCPNCGQPYPWTESLLHEADTIIDSFDELTDEQRKLLKERFPDLLSETPRSMSSALTFSKLLNGLSSVGSAVGKGFLIQLLEKHVPETLFTLMQLR